MSIEIVMENDLDHPAVAAIHDVFTLLCVRLRRRSKDGVG